MEMQRIVKGLLVNFTEFYLNFDTSDDLVKVEREFTEQSL